MTSPPTQLEALYTELGDPTTPNRVKNTAGFLVRTAADLARYERSTREHPDMTDHYVRLSRAAIHAARSRMQPWNFPGFDDLGFVEAVQYEVDQIPWEKIPDAPQPRIARALPFDGSEPAVHLQFVPNASCVRAEMPA